MKSSHNRYIVCKENLLRFIFKFIIKPANLSQFYHNHFCKSTDNLKKYLIETKWQGKSKTAYLIRVLCAYADTK